MILIAAFLIYKGSNSKNDNSSNSTSSSKISTNTSSTGSKVMEKPKMTTDTTKSYKAIMTTEAGPITIQLTADKTPITVNNFVTLAQNKFYDNVIFHRTISTFMIQGGDPTGTGTGGPGYKFDDEPFTGDYTKGTVAMANSGPNTNGSQFFIMTVDELALPKKYVIFGKVIEGQDVVDKIASAPTVQDGRENSKPVTPIKILNIQIVTE